MLKDSCMTTFHDLLCNIYTVRVKYGKYLVARRKYETGILATSCSFLLNKSDWNFHSFFTVVPCILILSKSFIYQLMHKRVALKEY